MQTKTNLATYNQTTLDTLLTRIASGKAIMFTGAGFTLESENIHKKNPPNAEDLAIQICNLGKFEEDKDLRFAADFYLAHNEKPDLIDLLKSNFTLTKITDDQVSICKANWRRFYTTNYDLSIESAAAKEGKLVECIDISMRPQEFYKRRNICVHLNGSLNSLNESSIESGFKLSTSSYISPDSFINSSWFYPFKQDLERCSALVFVGYSMYDIEIQKILFENSELREKTYFITRENPDSKTVFTMSKFGIVINIGVNGFAELLNRGLHDEQIANIEFPLESFIKYDISYKTESTRDADIESMLMYGDIKQDNVDNAVVGTQVKPYIIVREEFNKKTLDLLNNKKNVVIFSEFGNGKSVLLNQLLPYLTVNSYEVYTLVDKGGDYIGDIEKIAAMNQKAIIVIDGYESQFEILQHISMLSTQNIQVVLTARTYDHERHRSELKKIEFPFSELNVDYLSETESQYLVKIIDNVGLWGPQAHLSPEAKIKYLRHENNLQLSLALLNIFDAPQIVNRVKEVVRDLLDNPEFKQTLFAIAVLEILNLPVKSSLISEVAMNNSIYDSTFRHHQSFRSLFKLSENSVTSKSSLFCLSLIKNHFEASYIISQSQKIANKFQDSQRYSRDNSDENQVFKAMLRFSFIERLLPTQNKKGNLFKYYEDLKTSVPWLISSPHYWVQYGMSRLPYKDYPKAQQCLDQAYGLAHNREAYYTSNIDTQQGRLYLLKAIDTLDSVEAHELFTKAHKLFQELDDDVYKFRQVGNYRDYFESKYKDLSRANKAHFKTCCQKMLKAISQAENSGIININHQRTIAKAQENLEFIISRIDKV